MKKAIWLAMLLAGAAHADKVDSQCNIAKCEAGDIVKSYASKSEPYYACSTKELSEYTSFVLGMVSTHLMLVGKLPSISPATGEPEYEGESKQMLDYMRKKAKVSSFGEAVSSCEAGKNGVLLLVANSKKDDSSMWVYEQKRKLNYWIPKAFANKVK